MLRRSLLLPVLLSFLPLSLCQQVVSTPDQSWAASPYIQSRLHRQEKWFHGSATFYPYAGSGACGLPWSYVQPNNQYGVWSAATPDPRWSDTLTNNVPSFSGASCGQCYRLRCLNVPLYANEVFCNPNAPDLHVRITDCDTPRAGGWPNNHFDLSQEGFQQIANPMAGMVNVMWKREACTSITGSPKWSLDGDSNGFFHDVVIYDVPLTGSIVTVWARPAGMKWMRLQHAWGAHYYSFGSWSFDGTTKVQIKLAEHWGKRFVAYLQMS